MAIASVDMNLILWDLSVIRKTREGTFVGKAVNEVGHRLVKQNGVSVS